MVEEKLVDELRDIIIRSFGMRYKLSNAELTEILLQIPELAPLSLEDHLNIKKWISSTEIFIESKMRRDWSESELKTLGKLHDMELRLKRCEVGQSG